MNNSKLRIGDYEIEMNPKNKLGKGSFGVVYKGKHIHTEREVAIKRIELDQEDYDQTIFNEIRSMDHLQGHFNVVQLLDAIIKDIDCWIVMELCDLGDLQTYLQKNKDKLTLDNKINFMYQCVCPIAFMHEQCPPIIHRDIKPGNYLLQSGYQRDEITLKVTDFGLAKLTDRENAQETVNNMSATMCGTLHYMAPEFWVDGTLIYDCTVDTFALGLVFLVILEASEGSKDLPYTVKSKRDGIVSYIGNELQTAHKKGKRLPKIVDIQESDSSKIRKIKQLITQMTAFKPDERWPLSNVEEELQYLLTENSRSDPPHEIVPPAFRIERELTNLSIESDLDSGVMEQEADTNEQDSVAYSMLRSVTPSVEVDSAYQTQGHDPTQLSVIDQLRRCLESGSSYGSVFAHGDGGCDIKCGDVVRISDDVNKVRSAQQKCDKWEESMKECLGLPGLVTGIEDDKARLRCINQKRYIFSKEILIKEDLDISDITGGDFVAVKADKDYVEQIQKMQGGGWVKAMEKQVGQFGIVRCLKKGRVKVEHSCKDNFVWCKEALVLVAKGEEIIKVLLQKK